jgi:hypothetical protein
MKKNASIPIEFPLTLTERGVSTTIYRTTSKKNGVEYVSFILTWQSLDGRQRRSFSTLEKAKAEAAAVMAGILSGRATESLGLADAELLKRIRMEVDAIGRPVLSILEEYAAARKIVADSASIIDAARYWLDHVGRITQIQVADAFEEFKVTHAIFDRAGDSGFRLHGKSRHRNRRRARRRARLSASRCRRESERARRRRDGTPRRHAILCARVGTAGAVFLATLRAGLHRRARPAARDEIVSWRNRGVWGSLIAIACDATAGRIAHLVGPRSRAEILG